MEERVSPAGIIIDPPEEERRRRKKEEEEERKKKKRRRRHTTHRKEKNFFFLAFLIFCLRIVCVLFALCFNKKKTIRMFFSGAYHLCD